MLCTYVYPDGLECNAEGEYVIALENHKNERYNRHARCWAHGFNGAGVSIIERLPNARVFWQHAVIREG